MGNRRFVSVLSSVMLTAALVACGAKSVLTLDALDEVSGVRVTADNASADDVVASGGAIVVAQGDVLAISPDFQSGDVRLTVTSQDGSTVAFDDKVEGRGFFTVDVEPGAYDVKVTGDGATGTLNVFAMPESAIEEQGTSLKEQLESVKVTELEGTIIE